MSTNSLDGASLKIPHDDLGIQEIPSKVVNDVRINPSYLLFNNAYEGKLYEKQVVLQNIGKHNVHIRILQPQSNIFQFKPLLKGITIAPGLKIVRNVKFKFISAIALARTHVPIDINGFRINYEIFVTMAAPEISLDRECLDYGILNATLLSEKRTLTITNSGYKSAHYDIDLGTNELELKVEPMKGIINVGIPAIRSAKSSVKLKIEIAGTFLGKFIKEFWIRTSTPKRVIVYGELIKPQLTLTGSHDNVLTVCHFPVIYYGTKAIRNIVVENRSSTNAMFHIMVDINGKIMTFQEAKKIDYDVNYFTLYPMEGRIRSQKRIPIRIIFSPTADDVPVAHRKKCFCCLIRLIRVNFEDATMEKSPKKQNVTSSLSTETDAENPETKNADNNIIFSPLLESTSIIKVAIHAKAETARIVIRPDKIIINGLILEQSYYREVAIKNICKHGDPLIIKSQKLSEIDIEPSSFTLKSQQSIELLIRINCKKLMNVKTKLIFDIFAPDCIPGEKNYIHVGACSMKIEYDVVSAMSVPKESCLKQSILKEYGHIGARSRLMIQDSEKFRLTCSETEKKLKNHTYYKNYIENEYNNRTPILHKRLYLPVKIFCESNQSNLVFCKKQSPFFIPLTPSQLYFINIEPTFIRFEDTVVEKSTTKSINIKNLNPFPVRIILKSLKRITFSSDLFILKPNESRTIIVSIMSKVITSIFGTITILVNESHCFKISCYCKIVTRNLSLETTEIYFNAQDNNYKFIKIYNDLNDQCSFKWEIAKCNFRIFPMAGMVPSKRFLFCMIEYVPDPHYKNVVEADFIIDSSIEVPVEISTHVVNPKVKLDPIKIQFKEIPFNTKVYKSLTLQNNGKNLIYYTIVNDKPVKGIQILPKEGLLKGKEEKKLIIAIQVQTSFSFQIKAIINFGEKHDLTFELCGVVNCPLFSIEPNIFKFARINPYSFDSFAFKLTNLSPHVTRINIPKNQICELSITTSDKITSKHLDTIFFEPQQSKVLFCHLRPYDVCSYLTHLPIIINDVIGPPSLSNPSSWNYAYFLEKERDQYLSPDIKFLKDFSQLSLPLLQVNVCALKNLISITKYPKFIYFGENHYNNLTVATIKFKNISEERVSICIRTDRLCDPFILEPDHVPCLTTLDLSYTFSLDPSCEASFTACFQPEERDDYEQMIPIFVKHCLNNRIFNYMQFIGTYTFPILRPVQEEYILEPIPPDVEMVIIVELNVQNHFDNCCLKLRYNKNLMKYCINNGHEIFRDDKIKTIKLFIKYPQALKINESIEFRCSCNSCCKVDLKGTILSSTLVCHACINTIRHKYKDSLEYLIVKDQIPAEDNINIKQCPKNFHENYLHIPSSSFPTFPDDKDTSVYAKHMRTSVEILEDWIFSQGVFQKIYYKIPESFTDFNLIDPKGLEKDNSRPLEILTPPIVNIIMNLLGSKLRNYFMKGSITSSEEDDQMNFIFRIYENILKYLCSFGVVIPNIEIKYLLKHEHYLLFQKYNNIKIENDPYILRETFYLRSKQCWFDLLLRIIASLTLECRSEFENDRLESEKIPIENGVKNKNNLYLYCITTRKIMHWFIEHYNQNYKKLWTDDNKPKELDLLDRDLKDCLIFGAVTAFFCPYMIDNIKNMYGNPKSEEEIFHNCCVISEVWTTLKLSYQLNPMHLYKPNDMEMVLFLHYLYDILPSFTPKDTLVITASIMEDDVYKLNIKNPSSNTIYYQAEFLYNENDLFSLETVDFKITPLQTIEINIEYQAKFIKKASGLLFFCGEVPCKNYTKNLVFYLEGVTLLTDLFPVPINKIITKLYQKHLISMELKCPYNVEGSYKGYVCQNLEDPLIPIDNLFTPTSIYNPDIPLLMQQKKANVDKTGAGIVSALIFCSHPTGQSCTLFLKNPEIGDWKVTLEIKGKISESNYENLCVQVPVNFNQHKCFCKPKPRLDVKCLKIIQIPIPSRNIHLWDLAKSYVSTSLHNTNIDNNHDENHVIEKMLKCLEPSTTKNYTVDYIVKTGKNCPFLCAPTLKIMDVMSEDNTYMPVHIMKDIINKTVSIQLESKNKRELRLYKITFVEEIVPKRNDFFNDE